MSRFDLDDDGEGVPYEFWKHNLDRALASPKGQAKLREFRAALLAVPGRRLVSDWIADPNGDVCAIGAYAAWKRTQKGQAWAAATADLNQRFHPEHEPFLGRDTFWYLYGPREADAFDTQLLGVEECGLNRTLAWHLGYQNDEGDFAARTPEERWQRAYEWTCEQLGESLQPDRCG